jgi:hypothetical protein
MGGNSTIELVLDCSDPENLMGFWREALGYTVQYSERSLVVLVPRDMNASALLLQRVPEPKIGKNRVHVDMVTDDVEVEVKRLEGRSAQSDSTMASGALGRLAG